MLIHYEFTGSGRVDTLFWRKFIVQGFVTGFEQGGAYRGCGPKRKRKKHVGENLDRAGDS
jgi:hypothetical protein